jgi:phosphate starvation-inducible membrane PsiE
MDFSLRLCLKPGVEELSQSVAEVSMIISPHYQLYLNFGALRISQFDTEYHVSDRQWIPGQIGHILNSI